MSFLIAQAGDTYVGWIIKALGPLCLLILVLSGVASFIMTLAIVRKGKGPLAGSALMLAVLLPFFVGLYFAVLGSAQSFVAVAMEMHPKQNSIPFVLAQASFVLFIGMFLMIPSYLLAVIAATVRSRREQAT